MFYIQICVLEPEPVGAELLQVKPEPKFFTWSRSRKKISGAGSEEKWFGSATLRGVPVLCNYFKEIPV